VTGAKYKCIDLFNKKYKYAKRLPFVATPRAGILLLRGINGLALSFGEVPATEVQVLHLCPDMQWMLL